MSSKFTPKYQSPLVYPEFCGPAYKSEWRGIVPIEHYHADKTALNSGKLKYALDSGLSFLRQGLRGLGKQETPPMRLGSAAHLAMLQPNEFDRVHVAMPDFGDMRSSVNRGKRDEWMVQVPKGAMVLNQEELDKLRWMIEGLLRNRVACNLLKDAAFEQTGYFYEEQSGLKCRIRPDAIRMDLSAMPDLKTTRSARSQAFAREVWNRRYDMQLVFYMMGVKAIHGRYPDSPCFIAVENCEPYDVCVYEVDQGLISRGEADVRICLDRIKSWLEARDFPGRQINGAEFLSLPSFTDFIEVGTQ